jgi:hypothetical protein
LRRRLKAQTERIVGGCVVNEGFANCSVICMLSKHCFVRRSQIAGDTELQTKLFHHRAKTERSIQKADQDYTENKANSGMTCKIAFEV